MIIKNLKSSLSKNHLGLQFALYQVQEAKIEKNW